MIIYKIIYHESNVIQYKVMISHDEYLRIKGINDKKEREKQMSLLTEDNEWFTDKSEFYNAITSGYMKWYNGSLHRVDVIEVQ